MCLISVNNILNENQFGFRPQHSMIDAVRKFTSDILQSIDNTKPTQAVRLDLSKAFNSNEHLVLSYYGIRGIALDWFLSYLTNRNQYV